MAKIIDGKAISAQIKAEIKAECAIFTQKFGIKPGLAVVLVGDDPASAVYVRNKKRACEECGFESFEYILPSDTTQERLEGLIEELNNDEKVHGILVQLPLPAGLDAQGVIMKIATGKDVDAFHPVNVGRIMIGNYDFLPCTPAGVMELLGRSGIDVSGKSCVIIGRSDIVGKPMAMLLLHANGTVTICHSKTNNLKEICKKADILVSSVGKAGFVTADMVKDGAVVIDVGINRTSDGRLCGDVNYAEVEPIAGYITPVPGGVGPMTVTMLMKNTLTAAQKSVKI